MASFEETWVCEVRVKIPVKDFDFFNEKLVLLLAGLVMVQNISRAHNSS
jgi:hypothetical protein